MNNEQFDNSSDSFLNEECIEKTNEIDSFGMLEDILSDMTCLPLNNYLGIEKHTNFFTVPEYLSATSNGIPEQENILPINDKTESNNSSTFKILENEIRSNSLNEDIFENKNFDLSDNEESRRNHTEDNFPFSNNVSNEKYKYLESSYKDDSDTGIPDDSVHESSSDRLTYTDCSGNSHDEVINKLNPNVSFDENENLKQSYEILPNYSVDNSSYEIVSDNNNSSVPFYGKVINSLFSAYNEITLNCARFSGISNQYKTVSSLSSMETVSERRNLSNKHCLNSSLNYGFIGDYNSFNNSNPNCNDYPIKFSDNNPYKPEIDDISSDDSDENETEKKNVVYPVPEKEFPETEERFFFLEKLTLEYKRRIKEPTFVANYDVLFNLVKKYRLNYLTISMYPREYLVTIISQNIYDTDPKLIPVGAYNYTNRSILSAIDNEVVTDELIVLTKMQKDVQLLYDGYLIVKVQKFIYEDKPAYVDFILLRPTAIPVSSKSESISEYNDYLQKQNLNMYSENVKRAILLHEKEMLLNKSTNLCLDTKSDIPFNWIVKPYDMPNEKVEEYVRSKLKKPKRMFNPKSISKELLSELKNDSFITKTYQNFHPAESEKELENICSIINDVLDIFNMVSFGDFKLKKEENEEKDDEKEKNNEHLKEIIQNEIKEKVVEIQEKSKGEIMEKIKETIPKEEENKNEEKKKNEKRETQRKEKMENKKNKIFIKNKEKKEFEINEKIESYKGDLTKYEEEELVQPLFSSALVQRLAIYLYNTKYEYEDIPFWEVPCTAYQADVIDDFIFRNSYRKAYKYVGNRRIYKLKKELKINRVEDKKQSDNNMHKSNKRTSEEELLKENSKQRKIYHNMHKSNKRTSEEELLKENSKQRKIFHNIHHSNKRISEEELLNENKQRNMKENTEDEKSSGILFNEITKQILFSNNEQNFNKESSGLFLNNQENIYDRIKYFKKRSSEIIFKDKPKEEKINDTDYNHAKELLSPDQARIHILTELAKKSLKLNVPPIKNGCFVFKKEPEFIVEIPEEISEKPFIHSWCLHEPHFLNSECETTSDIEDDFDTCFDTCITKCLDYIASKTSNDTIGTSYMIEPSDPMEFSSVIGPSDDMKTKAGCDTNLIFEE